MNPGRKVMSMFIWPDGNGGSVSVVNHADGTTDRAVFYDPSAREPISNADLGRGWEDLGWTTEEDSVNFSPFARPSTPYLDVVRRVNERMMIRHTPPPSFAKTWVDDFDAEHGRAPWVMPRIELDIKLISLRAMHIAIGMHDEKGEPGRDGRDACTCGEPLPWARGVQ